VNVGAITADAAAWARHFQWCPQSFAGKLISLCPPGCFDSATTISTDPNRPLEGRPIDQLARGERVTTLQSDGTSLAAAVIEDVIVGPEAPNLLVFELSNGRTLRVTEAHPLVLPDGRVVAAGEVHAGEALASANHEAIRIVSVGREPSLGAVYNLRLSSSEVSGHVVVADGVLCGDSYLQNLITVDDDIAIGLRQ
jgi:hypothetical protein